MVKSLGHIGWFWNERVNYLPGIVHKVWMEYEKCYVFQPEDARPTKKRKTEPQGLQASWRLRKQAYPRGLVQTT